SRPATARRRLAIRDQRGVTDPADTRGARFDDPRVLRRVQPPGPACRAHECVGGTPRDEAIGIRLKKKRPRPSEADRPDVAAQRDAFLAWMKTVDARRLVFLDESGTNLAMGRSHAWVRRGEEYVE